MPPQLWTRREVAQNHLGKAFSGQFSPRQIAFLIKTEAYASCSLLVGSRRRECVNQTSNLESQWNQTEFFLCVSNFMSFWKLSETWKLSGDVKTLLPFKIPRSHKSSALFLWNFESFCKIHKFFEPFKFLKVCMILQAFSNFWKLWRFTKLLELVTKKLV